jgi:hypothetical protein
VAADRCNLMHGAAEAGEARQCRLAQAVKYDVLVGPRSDDGGGYRPLAQPQISCAQTLPWGETQAGDRLAATGAAEF